MLFFLFFSQKKRKNKKFEVNLQYKLNKMAKGTVKFFNDSKGFGFIVDQETEKEIFVHVSGLVDEVKENDEVTFDVAEGRKGPNAVDVRLA
tara:strand:+ start:218 stop:490 length:273 start_codon:yes stop_codon:yes gene_type:complete